MKNSVPAPVISIEPSYCKTVDTLEPSCVNEWHEVPDEVMEKIKNDCVPLSIEFFEEIEEILNG